MKKRILLLFVAMIGMATSSGWAQTGDTGSNKESFIGTTDDVTAFKSYMSIKMKILEPGKSSTETVMQ